MAIAISRPSFDEVDFAAVIEPLRTGWVAQGPLVRRFEEQFSAYTGLPRSVAVSSCTTALHAALAALEIGPGDEVLVPAFTWIATANAVRYVGATPVFVDVSLDSFNVDLDALAAAITPRTRAMIPVHLFGNPVDMDRVMALASAHGVHVVEDAACGFGSYWRGTHVGAFGDAGCFSFHPRKAITTGEGGMITTRFEAVERAVRSLRDHGANRDEPPAHDFLLAPFDRCGFNYRMTDLQGALGCSQLLKADAILAGRARVARGYAARLAGRDWLRLPEVTDGGTHSWQSYVCLFAPNAPSTGNRDEMMTQRNSVMAELSRRGIATRQGTHSVPHTRLYSALSPTDCSRSLLAESLSMALPVDPSLQDDELDQVVDALDAAFATVVGATVFAR